jgi:hypothetical protein
MKMALLLGRFLFSNSIRLQSADLLYRYWL